MKVFTIGFSRKSGEEFFNLLTSNNIKKLVDIRLNNKSQLAGFANAKHLPYFLKLHNVSYEYRPELAPSKELLDNYKKNVINWEEYEDVYFNLLKDRNILSHISIEDFESAAFLCSEPTAEKCHRRLFVEYLSQHFNHIAIKHL